MRDPTDIVDAIVIGGGPAGLSAALLLGRCRRSVLVFDEGRPRNEKSPLVHLYLGLIGVSPAELLSRGREQLSHHPNVSFFHESVETATWTDDAFSVTLASGMKFRSRSLLLATGIIDRLPPVPGIEEFYGTSIHLCPYCDGWESSDQSIGVHGSGNEAAELALEMLLWSDRISLFIDGDWPDEALCGKLAGSGIALEASPLAGFRGSGGQLERILLDDGREVRCNHLFLVASQVQHDGFIKGFGIELTTDSKTENGSEGVKGIPGLFVAGNVSKGLQLAMVAGAEGLKAAHGINSWLLDLDQQAFASPTTQPYGLKP